MLPHHRRPIGREPSERLLLLGPACVLLALALGPPPAAAQIFTFQRLVGGIPVNVGFQIPEAFTGGLDSPKPDLIDLDNDGDLDLLIVQPDGGITHFRNIGGPSAFVFRFATDDLQGIDARTWATYADIDDDGDLDLFTDGNGTVAFHRNVGNPSQPFWQLVTNNFQGIENSGFGNTPSFVDVDGDGDLDYLEMEQNFGTARFYRNSGTPVNADFDFVTNTFGCIDTFVGIQGAPGPVGAAAGGAPGREADPQHGISVISTVDIDDDNDVDIMIGDLVNPNLWYFRNTPGQCVPACTPSTVCYTKITDSFLPIETLGLNHARFGDLDNDDDFDLLIGVTNQGATIDNLIYFINSGTPQAPNYVPVDLNLIKAIDVGRGSHPAGGDLNGDGRRDLFIGGESGMIEHFRNVGTPTAPSLVLQSPLEDQNDVPIDVGLSSAPVLIDHEGDGDLDLFVGTGSPARVRFYRNTGTPLQASFALINSQFGNVQADFNAAPALGDLDDDGDLDLLVGEFGVTNNPRLFYMRNDGTTQAPIWVMVSDNTPNTFIYAQRVYTGELSPELFDIDADGDLDLFLGERDGNVNFYRNTGTPQAFTFVLQSEAFAAALVGNESAPEFVDMTGDGFADLFVGERGGGLNYYRRVPPVGIEGPEPEAPSVPALRIAVVPNPIRAEGHVVLSLAAAGRARAGLYSADGRLVRVLGEELFGAGEHRLPWDGRGSGGARLAPGIYFLALEANGTRAATKLTVLP
jgi:large repetitive protein